MRKYAVALRAMFANNDIEDGRLKPAAHSVDVIENEETSRDTGLVTANGHKIMSVINREPVGFMPLNGDNDDTG